MSVVVTGAAGFVGTHLVAALRRAGHTVVGIDRRPAPPAEGFVPLTVDLLDGDEAADDALRQAEAVFHVAGLPGVRDTSEGVEERRIRDNVLATERVLGLVPPDTPLVVTSSSSVYGGTPDGRPCREDGPLRPLGGYAASKLAMERRCEPRAAAGGLVTVCRLFTVAGEGQRPDMALSLWTEAVLAGRPLRVLGSTRRSRDLVDVRHVVTALRLLAERATTATVNVGTGTGHTLAEMIAALGAALGREPVVQLAPPAEVDPAATLADPSRLEALTGFRPRTDLEALVRRQVAAALTARGQRTVLPEPTGVAAAAALAAAAEQAESVEVA